MCVCFCYILRRLVDLVTFSNDDVLLKFLLRMIENLLCCDFKYHIRTQPAEYDCDVIKKKSGVE